MGPRERNGQAVERPPCLAAVPPDPSRASPGNGRCPSDDGTTIYRRLLEHVTAATVRPCSATHQVRLGAMAHAAADRAVALVSYGIRLISVTVIQGAERRPIHPAEPIEPSRWSQ